MWKFPFLVCLVLAVVLGGDDITRIDASVVPVRRNIYNFESAFGDIGAFRRFFDGQEGRDPIVAGVPIYPDPGYYGPPLSRSRIELYGPLDRFSDGRNWVDFFCESFGLMLHDAYALEFLPTGKRHFINFAIGGATVNGNTFNNLTPNSDFDEVSGLYGYTYQLETFLELKNNIPSIPITENDIFILAEIGANDIPAIAYASQSNPEDIPGFINTFIGTYMSIIQTLYDNGARKMLITYADGSAYELIPAMWKVDPSGNVKTAIQDLSNDVWSAFFAVLDNQINTTMLELEVDIIPIGEPVQNWLIFIDDHGVRRPQLSDVGDPRDSQAMLPFPTYYDMLEQRGVHIHGAFFYSDLHPTEHTYQEFSKIYETRLKSYFV